MLGRLRSTATSRRLRGLAARRRVGLGALVFVASSLSLVAAAPAPAGTLVEPWIDTGNRDAVSVAWAVERDRAVPSMDWTGAYDGCEPGGASRDLAVATIGRVNFYRAMAGVPASVRLNDAYSAKAQHTALTMSAAGVLSHAPDDTFACLDTEAREGAANSNLYLGRIGPSAVDGYIEDPGEHNRDVGHRNTILHPPTTQMGVGHVAGTADLYPANALWVFDDRVFDVNPAVREPDGFVAWPPRGYVPAPLVHPRWSLSLVGADFDDATVAMTVDGRPVELDVVTRHSVQGYVPSPIVVWEPSVTAPAPLTGGPWPGDREADLEVTVRVSGIEVDGRTLDVDYRVSIMAPDPPASGLIDAAVKTVGRTAGLLLAGTPATAG